MKSSRVILTTLLAVSIVLIERHASAADTADDSSTATTLDWRQWRGPAGDGVAPDGKYPTEWSENDHIVFRQTVPGRGASTPVVAGDQIYLTAGVDGENRLLAFDAASGKIRWQKSLGQDAGNKHRKGGGSNPSVVVGEVDGKPIAVAYFRSGDVAAVDADGNIQWQMNIQSKFAADTLWWDLGSSPVLVDDSIIIAVVQTGPSYLVRLNLADGAVVWKVDRDVPAPKEAAQTYATPTLVNHGDQRLIAVTGADHVTLHTIDDGRMVASRGGMNPDQNEYFRSISSPVSSGEMLVVPYSRGETLTGLNVAELAKDSKSAAWQIDGFGSDVPTPAVVGSTVYITEDSKQSKGTIAAVDTTTGKRLWSLQLPKSRKDYSSSPLVAGNNLYVLREDAVTFVIGPLDSDQPSLIATNELPNETDTGVVASPAPIGGNGLLIRTADSLYRIGEL